MFVIHCIALACIAILIAIPVVRHIYLWAIEYRCELCKGQLERVSSCGDEMPLYHVTRHICRKCGNIEYYHVNGCKCK